MSNLDMLGSFIWIGYLLLLSGIIVISFFLTKYNKFEYKIFRNGFVLMGALVGIIAFFLVFVEQPRIENIIVNYILGIPIAVFGIIGRIYAALYLRTKGTTTTLDKVSSLISSGPYGWVRHPQYTTGILSIAGWFMMWGASYCLLIFPLLTSLVVIQAFIEEKNILEKEFGEGYSKYQKQVGMFFPKIRINF
ncbi:MAG: methyltransferase family protein [Candidatus Hodarchaeota archaeon]